MCDELRSDLIQFCVCSCAHTQSVKSMTADINAQYLKAGGQLYIELHSDTLYKVCICLVHALRIQTI